MTVQVSVRSIHEHLWRQNGSNGDGQRSNAVLGALFHEVASKLCAPTSSLHVVDLLKEHGNSSEAILRATYENIVGPRLSASQAQLAAASAEVLHFWTALKELLGWLGSLGSIALENRSADAAKELFIAEEPVRARFRQPSWTDDVEVTGVLDLLLSVPNARWCLVELKLGKGSPEADLTQACLYHLLLTETGRTSGKLALVGFAPEKIERFLGEEETASLRGKLLDVIGRVAGVVSSTPASNGQRIATPPPQQDSNSELAKRLVSAFREYGVEIKLKQPSLGPAFLRFPVELGRGQAIGKLSANAENVQARVGLKAPPLITVDRGRVVMDVERPDRQVVRLADVRSQIVEAAPRGAPLLPIGVDHEGRVRFANLADPLNCHFLVAGTTGSGKSEWLRFALAGIALRLRPDEVKLVLIDPKRTAFLELRDSPYLHAEHGLVFPDEHSIHDVLHDLAEEMDRRYVLFSEVAADDLASYVAKTKSVLPRILVVCDEYYDLVARGGREQKAIEEGIGRLGAKARAAGIHLILATQQPSRQVIRGAIKANIPSRVALTTKSAIESNMMLEEPGAEALLYHGDLLFKDVGQPVRLQAPLTAAEDRRAIFANRSNDV